MTRRAALAALFVWLVPAPLPGQQTRAELLDQLRAERAHTLHPYRPNRLKQGLLYIEVSRVRARLGQGLSGLYPRPGGFTTCSGFGLGIGARHALPGTRDFEVDASFALSARGYRSVDVQVPTPALAGGRVELDRGTRWWDYTQEDYFGLGESSRADRTSSRYAGLGLNLVTRVRPRRWLSADEDIGCLRPDIRSGTDSRFPSVEARFSDAEAPGLARQPRLVYARTFVDLDYRDQPGTPRAGGHLLFQIGTGRDQDRSREFSYRRTDLTVLHVFPLFDKKRQFAVRLAGAHVGPLAPGGRVPFFLFLSPTIGGSDTVRSYRERRFRDATCVVANVEYRWEAFSGLGLAGFWDGGDVGTTIEQIRLDECKTGWGFGLRFNTNRSIFMRRDAGFGGVEEPRLPRALAGSGARRPASPTTRSLSIPGDSTDRRAMNVNTADGVPESRWCSHRAGVRPPSAADVRRGPDTMAGPAPGTWTVVQGRSDGIIPGFTIRDTAGVTWFINPASNPEMTAAAEMIAPNPFWALGYHVPANHPATLSRDNLVLITRRDKIGDVRLTGVNPLADCTLSAHGVRRFRKLAVDHRRAAPADRYEVQWARFDNTTGTSTPMGPLQTRTDPSATLPLDPLGDPGVEARVSAPSSAHPEWARPVTVRFRREGPRWTLTGLERLLDRAVPERGR